MSILTLTANRSLAPFAEGSYGYAYADHGVRKDGVLITPTALTQTVGASGAISFDLVPSDRADDCEQFTYTVAAFDPNGRRIFIANIVMPDTDVSIWSLLPKEVDLDLRGALAAVVAEPEPDVYCGIEPVDPGELNNGIPDTPVVPLISGIYNNDFIDVFNLVADEEAFEAISGDIESTQYTFVGGDIVDVLLPDYTPGEGSTVSILGRVHRSESSSGPILSLFEVDTTTQIQLDDERVQPGRVIRIRRRTDDNAFELVDSYVEGPSITQADIDAYNAAKATYDQCIADGGIAGRDPSVKVYCGVEPVDPGVAGTLIVAGAFADGDASGGRYTTRDYDSAVGDNTFTPLTHDIDLSDLTVVFDLVLHTTPSEGNGFQVDGSAPIFRIATTVGSVSNYKRASLHDVESAGSVFDPYPSSGDRYDYIVNKFIDIPLVEGTVLRFGVNQYSTTWGVFDLVDVAQPTLVTQDQVDAYTAAKATYDQCIADGGIPGEQP